MKLSKRSKEILDKIKCLKIEIVELQKEYALINYEGLSKTEYTKKQRKILLEANTKSREELTREFIAQAKANPPKSELIFKAKLKLNSIKYVWQKEFITDHEWYIADFYLPEYNMIVELDGGYHNLEQQKTKDRKKNAFYRRNGYYLLRIKNEVADKISADEMKDYLTKHWLSEKILKAEADKRKPIKAKKIIEKKHKKPFKKRHTITKTLK